MAISVVKAVSQAVARTKYVLFTTFSASKWLLLAVCAFLSQCDSGGGLGSQFGNITSNIPAPPGGIPGPTPPLPPTGPGGTTAPVATTSPAAIPAVPALPTPPTTMPGTSAGTMPAISQSTAPATAPATSPTIRTISPITQVKNLARAWANWISANLTLALAYMAVGLALALALTALFSWISCRGRLMLIDGIVQNRGAVVEPWGAFKQLGNSLFGWSFGLNVVGFFTTIAIVAIGAGIALLDIRADQFGTRATIALAFVTLFLIASTLAFTLVRMLLSDFVVPAMYLHNLRVRPAWQLVKREILADYVGEVVLFYLMGIVLSIATMMIGVAISCLTCCVTAFPFVGTVILLPLIVFRRCYGLCFIEQFGPRWTVFFDAGQRCRKCGYDLRYTPNSAQCPECGSPRENWTAPLGVSPPIFPA